MSVKTTSLIRTSTAAIAICAAIVCGCEPQGSNIVYPDGDESTGIDIDDTDPHLLTDTDSTAGISSETFDVPLESDEQAAPKKEEVTQSSERYIAASSLEEALAIFDEMDRGGPVKNTHALYSYDISPCRLFTSNVYLRKSSGYKSVGSKPYTECKYPVTSINHVTGIDYRSWLWWNSAGPDTTGGNSGAESYTQRNVAYRCSSLEENTFRGTTFGIVIFQGETFYSRVHTPIRELECEI